MPGVNQVFFFRYPAVPITGIVAQLLSFPLGKLWETYVPQKRILGVSLNPGPFSIKEHVLITVCLLFVDEIGFHSAQVLSSCYRSWPRLERSQLTQ
jgi:hypothetical protein